MDDDILYLINTNEDNIYNIYNREEEISAYSETESDDTNNIYIEELEQTIEVLKLQIEQLKKRNNTLKSVLLSKVPDYLNNIINFL